MNRPEELIKKIYEEQGHIPVSYTHLDVYKRQYQYRRYKKCLHANGIF